MQGSMCPPGNDRKRKQKATKKEREGERKRKQKQKQKRMRAAAAGDNVDDSGDRPASPRNSPSAQSEGPPSTPPTESATPATAIGHNPKIKNPRHHYDAAVACMARRACRTGHVAALVARFGTADRAACDSLAAYQHLLMDTRRRLARLGADPGDGFAVWVALAGLKDAHRRWHGTLVAQRAAGRLDWDGLMAAMAGRACRE
ncbi:hypothetical protein HMPREF1624_04196 [Sporothrix schenckii ATCC 58251]|uniref:Uncharacterized protein n=1 Tax=Sporothrix schenckii (strain ATCC 58251 / de Perez 2211183) TaxID=1391915 RepID=U7PVQ8_SPOS1|nr:hypothetical protein HMPREF1624_04196 [Sporothrix schenckii ATCC 58251]